jgi:hypothetical protein
MSKKETIKVKGTEITIISQMDNDFICITDIAKYKSDDPAGVINNWMRNRNTVEFLGFWETLYNPNFKPLEFERFRGDAGLNSFTLSPQKWIEATNSTGLISKSGRYGGTYAHKDIAFKFASWISIEFELYIVKEFQRLKEEEMRTNSLAWNLQRTLSIINYRIHTDAIKEHIIPNIVTKLQIVYKLSNMESINALLIQQQLSQSERLIQLNNVAIAQMKSLIESKSMKKLK